MKVSVKGSTLVIELPMSKPPPLSKSEKTRIVAGTKGFADAGLQVGGKQLRIAVNAIVAA